VGEGGDLDTVDEQVHRGRDAIEHGLGIDAEEEDDHH
jgi:hypothetical protein